MNHLSHSVRLQRCTNCGLTGHVFHHCLSPITSYGIIAIRFCQTPSFFSKSLSPSDMEFLLIQRKDSLAFNEFLRGKYNYHDIEYISKLLKDMTIKEQQSILTKTFHQLWTDLWGENSTLQSHKNNYELSEKRFNQLIPTLPELVEKNPTRWNEPEWGFPKGRRNPYESDIHCEIREFQEETGLTSKDFSVIQNTQSISETFFGSNHVHYCHKYYFAICPSQIEVEFNKNNHHMAREIGDIRWFTLENALTVIRPDNIEKREILLKAGKILKNFYPVLT